MTTIDEYARGNRDQVPATPLNMSPGTFSLNLVQDMLQTMRLDRGEFEICHDYLDGKHLEPYAPRNTTAQIRDLQQRSIANMMPLLVNLPSQMSFVDDYRRRGQKDAKHRDSKPKGKDAADPSNPEWDLWQKNRMDGRQAILYRALLTYGHAFICVNNVDKEDIRFDILSTRNTVAYFRDPVNDIRPSHVLTVMTYPRRMLQPDGISQGLEVDGLAILWDDEYRWELTYNIEGEMKVKGKPFKHGLGKCPVIRYTCFVDDEGRTMGVVKPAIPLQDRLNQATFDTGVTASFGAFKVRTAAGLMPSFRKDPSTGELLLDANGEPIPEPIEVSQASILVSTNSETKFSQLDETPLDGYLKQEEQAARNFTMISQFPPLASISNLANLSAEAWAAAEAQFIRWIDSLHISLGESHEELMRTAALALGDIEGSKSYGGEVRWRDMSTKAMGVTMDGLGKAAMMLDAPKKGLWPMIPGITNGMLDDWEVLHEEQMQEQAMMDPGIQQATAAAAQKPTQPKFGQTDPNPPGRPKVAPQSIPNAPKKTNGNTA